MKINVLVCDDEKGFLGIINVLTLFERKNYVD